MVRRCPACGSHNISTTLVGYTGRDYNKVFCDCGWCSTAYDAWGLVGYNDEVDSYWKGPKPKGHYGALERAEDEENSARQWWLIKEGLLALEPRKDLPIIYEERIKLNPHRPKNFVEIIFKES